MPLGEWVLRQACAQGAAWRRASWDIGVSVNLSARQVTAPGFPAQVAAILADPFLAEVAALLPRLDSLQRTLLYGAVRDRATGQRRTA